MKPATLHLKALPLAAALLLGGCELSPMGVESSETNQGTMWIEDERELEVWLLRPTTPVDTLVHGAAVSPRPAALSASSAR